jgi:6-pyruvoyltetrahydropterin/6-carboxytetrahydropterin synthase
LYTIEIRHNVESAHRFYAATSSSKCRNIHGHSWLITLTLAAPQLDNQGMVLEFGQIKRVWRDWLDTHVDHGIMLHSGDPMIAAIQSVEPDARIFALPQDPTTENVAEFLFHQAQALLEQLTVGNQVHVQQIHVQETHVNAATYRPH